MAKVTDPAILDQLNRSAGAPRAGPIVSPRERIKPGEAARIGISRGGLDVQRGRLKLDQEDAARDAEEDASTEAGKKGQDIERRARIATALDNLDDLEDLVNGSWLGLGTGSIVGQEGFRRGEGMFGMSGLFNQTANNVEGSIEMVQGDLIKQVRLEMLAGGTPIGGRGVDTEKEAQRIAASIANLSQTQGEEEFLQGVRRARDYYRRRDRDLARRIKAAGQAASPVAKGIGATLSTAPVSQAVGVSTGVAAQEVARESGASPAVQLGENVVGSLAGAFGVQKVSNLRNAMRTPAVRPQAVQEADDVGVRLMTSDVKPPKTFIGKQAQVTGERIPFTGTSAPRAAQQETRKAAITKLLREFGGDDAAHLREGGPSLIDDIAANLSKTRSASIERLTTAKNSVIDGIDGSVPAPKAVQAIAREIRRLQGINAQEYAPVIQKLRNFGDVLMQGKTLRQVEGNRKLLGDMFEDASLASVRGEGQKSVNAIYAPLRDDMGNFIEAQAGTATRTRWTSANDELSSMMGELSDSAFKRALRTSEMTPENVGNLIFNTKRSVVARLYENLDVAGKAKMQAAILQRAFNKAVSPVCRDVSQPP